jgi:hypothetical protein
MGNGQESGGLDAGDKAGSEGLVVLEIPGIDGWGFAFGGAGEEQSIVSTAAGEPSCSGVVNGSEIFFRGERNENQSIADFFYKSGKNYLSMPFSNVAGWCEGCPARTRRNAKISEESGARPADAKGSGVR